jgi:prevent-host-death family protein
MKQVVSKYKFKPQALEYFRQVEESGEPLIITDRGKPVLKILPYSKHPIKSLAALRGSVVKYEKPLEPVGQEIGRLFNDFAGYRCLKKPCQILRIELLSPPLWP